MGLKLIDGTYALQNNGLPEPNTEEEELLQNAQLRLAVRQGSFPYGRTIGSRLAELNRNREHAEEQAVSLANEALLDLPGVQAEEAMLLSGGGMYFILSTPVGTKNLLLTL